MSLRTNIINKLVALFTAGWSKGTVVAQRTRQQRGTKYLRLPANIQHQCISIDSVSAEWLSAPDATEGVLLYFHGGAYVLGLYNQHRGLIARLSRATKMRALAVDYRLAPEYPYPAALEDAVTAYLWLLNEGVDASRVIVAGDSAGGGLALATLVALRDAGRPLPAGAVCLSPWTDLAITGASVHSKAQCDPVLAPSDLEMYAQLYARHYDRMLPRISPLYADLAGLPPLLIQVGSNEVLLDDAVRCADKAREAGVTVTLEISDEMFHNFQLLEFLPETKKAMQQIVRFVSSRLD